jgi:hypothetical protein
MKRDEWSEYIWEENSSTQNGDAPLAEKGEVVNIRQITVEHKNKMCVSVFGVCFWTRCSAVQQRVQEKEGSIFDASKAAQSLDGGRGR